MAKHSSRNAVRFDVRAILLVAWAVLASASFVPPSAVPVHAYIHAAAFAFLVAALYAMAVMEPRDFKWGAVMSIPLRICFVLMIFAGSSVARRVDYKVFAICLVASVAVGAAFGVLGRRYRRDGARRTR